MPVPSMPVWLNEWSVLSKKAKLLQTDLTSLNARYGCAVPPSSAPLPSFPGSSSSSTLPVPPPAPSNTPLDPTAAHYKKELSALRTHVLAARSALLGVQSAASHPSSSHPATSGPPPLPPRQLALLAEKHVGLYQSIVAAVADYARVKQCELADQQRRLEAEVEACVDRERRARIAMEETLRAKSSRGVGGASSSGVDGAAALLDEEVEMEEMEPGTNRSPPPPRRPKAVKVKVPIAASKARVGAAARARAWSSDEESDSASEAAAGSNDEDEDLDDSGARSSDDEEERAARDSDPRRKMRRLNSLLASLGGPAGPWHRDEHAAFLSSLTKAGGFPLPGGSAGCVQACRLHHPAELRGLSDAEVAQHYEFHATRTAVEREIKAALRAWREEKEATKKERVAAALENAAAINDGENVDPNKKARMEEELRKAEIDKKDAVRAWREAKAKEEEAKEMDKKAALEEARAAEERRAERHRYLRAKVGDYKKVKEVEEEREARLQQMKATMEKNIHPLTKEEVAARIATDLKKAEDRRIAADLKARSKDSRSRQLEARGAALKNAAPKVGRDFARLTKNTGASEKRAYTAAELDDKDEAERRKGAHEKAVACSGRDLHGVSGQGLRRATPSWRQGL